MSCDSCKDYIIVKKDDLSNLNSNILDLQVDVDQNKIDIIELKQNNSTSNAFSTISDLEEFDNGATFVYVVDDGKDGLFKFDETDTTTPTNTGTVIVINNKRYKRVDTNQVNVKWFGAKADGITDDTISIQNAIDYVFSLNGGTVFFPTGKYVLSSDTIVIKQGVILKGADKLPAKSNYGSDNRQFVITSNEGDETKPCFLAKQFSGLSGFSFYYPNQLKTNSIPIKYGWTITTDGTPSMDGIQLTNLMLTNSYKGIFLDYGGQHTIENIHGQPIHTGFRIDRSYDVSRLVNVHFWPYYTGGYENLNRWIVANGIAFDINGVDGIQGGNLFAYGYANGMRYTNNGSNSPWVSFNNILLDVCKNPIYIRDAYEIKLNNVTITGTTVFDSQDGIFIDSTINDLSTFISITDLHVVNFTTGVRNKAKARIQVSGVSKFYQTNINNGVRQYEIINENINALFVYNTVFGVPDDYKRLAGRLTINGVENYKTLTDITPNGFSSINNWINTQGNFSVVPITNGSRIDTGKLTNNEGSPLNVRSFAIPNQVINEIGLFVFKLTLKVNQLAGLNVIQFFIRLRDFSVGPNIDFSILPFALDAYYNSEVTLEIPFVYNGSKDNSFFDIVWGNNISTNDITFDITNIRLYKAKGFSTSFLEKIPKHQNFKARIQASSDDVSYINTPDLTGIFKGTTDLSNSKFINTGDIRTLNLPSGVYCLGTSVIGLPTSNTNWMVIVEHAEDVNATGSSTYRVMTITNLFQPGLSWKGAYDPGNGGFVGWFQIHTNKSFPVDFTTNPVNGDMLVFNNNNWTKVSVGTVGQTWKILPSGLPGWA